MKQSILLVLTLALCLSLVAASPVESVQEVYDTNEAALTELLALERADSSDEEVLTAQKKALLAKLDKVQEQPLPSLVATLFANERVNIHIDGGYTVAAVLDDGEITRLEEGELYYATVNVYVHDAAITTMEKGDFDFLTAVDEGDISYEGVGFMKQAKLSMMTSMAKLFL
jgi:hypothetical protein